MEVLRINNEECRNIAGFKRYHVSESGRVYRTDTDRKRSSRTKDRVYLGESKVHFKRIEGVLKQSNVFLTDKNGVVNNVALAPLIAIAFGITKKKKLSQRQKVGYRDADETNLHYTNLFVADRVYSGIKLTERDVKHIRKYIRQGLPLRRIAHIFSVSEMQISRIKTGENWGNGKRKIKAPAVPFEVTNGRMRKYVATFNFKKTVTGIKKRFSIKRNPENPNDNLIVGIVNGYKLSLKHTNITRARISVQNLNDYFFDKKVLNR